MVRDESPGFPDTNDPGNVTVLICGPDGICTLCTGEDRTGTDGCGSYFHVPGRHCTEPIPGRTT